MEGKAEPGQSEAERRIRLFARFAAVVREANAIADRNEARAASSGLPGQSGSRAAVRDAKARLLARTRRPKDPPADGEDPA